MVPRRGRMRRLQSSEAPRRRRRARWRRRLACWSRRLVLVLRMLGCCCQRLDCWIRKLGCWLQIDLCSLMLVLRRRKRPYKLRSRNTGRSSAVVAVGHVLFQGLPVRVPLRQVFDSLPKAQALLPCLVLVPSVLEFRERFENPKTASSASGSANLSSAHALLRCCCDQAANGESILTVSILCLRSLEPD